MSSLKRYGHQKKDRKEIAIQSQPIQNIEDYQHEPPSLKQQSTPIRPAKDKIPATTKLIKHLQQVQTNRQKAIQLPPQRQFSKSINLNMMKLQDKHFEINNIYNISIGDVANRETYLSGLQDEIANLRKKIQQLEEEENQRAYNTMYMDEEKSSHINSEYQSINNAKQSGRIYSKGSARNHSARKSLSFLNKRQEQSTFYKWKPQVNEPNDFQSLSKEITSISSKNTKNPEEIKSRSISIYRVKNTNIRQIGRSKYQQTCIEADELNSMQPEQPIPKQSQQNRQIFVINSEQWQINNVNDDFRQKINKKLQIPLQFPIDPPNSTSTIEQYQILSKKIYQIFNLNTDKFEEKLIIRKFKNGVYYQMKPNKNIVWYFSGAFYIGDWQTDLPSEGEKNGFGFQYIPKKYYYLGQFKNGMRDGKGAIKIIPSTNSPQFMAYDGQWLKGKPHGLGKHIDQKGNKYIGHFQNGEKTGNCMSLTKEGLFYQGQIQKGLKNGRGTEKLVNGDEYIGQFIDGKFCGEGTYKWKNGSEYTGQFRNGKRQGKGRWKSYNGDQFVGQYLADIKHGWGRFNWANGQMYEGQFRNDIRHGEGTYKHPNGKMGKFMWKDGEIEHRMQGNQQQYRCRHIKQQAQNI